MAIATKHWDFSNRGWIAFGHLIRNVPPSAFARRVLTYKRLTLMLRDPDRLEHRCSTNSGPIQLD